jgi:hypothetical protein
MLYKKVKQNISSSERHRIKEVFASLEKIKNSDYNDKFVKEIVRQITLLTYNKKNIVLNTWDSINTNDTKLSIQTTNITPKTKSSSDSSEYTTSSDSSESEDEKPQLISCKQPRLITNKKPKDIEL